MGIHGLTSLLKKVAPHCIRVRDLTYFKGKHIAIDTSLFMHKFMYGYGNLVTGFFYQISHLRTRGILPVYVFDGKPPMQKHNVIQSRKNTKRKAKMKIVSLTQELDHLHKMVPAPIMAIPVVPLSTSTAVVTKDKDTSGTVIEKVEEPMTKEKIELKKKTISKRLVKLNKQMYYITKKDIRNLKLLFDLMNIPYYDAEGEADPLCVYLSKNNVTYGCMTEDMDFLTHGCQCLIREFHMQKTTVTEYCLTDILQCLEITYLQFVDFCILCGCDYTSKIKGLGPVGALKLIKKYQSIEVIIDACCGENKRYTLPSNFDYENARKLFHGSNQEMSYVSHHNHEMKLQSLHQFLKENTTMKDSTIHSNFIKLF